ncbi:hypothetical protein ACTNEO_15515 [Gracilibacillus sp. HCP3S3_G5_1]|uniref:hypothetical protein n=1 Tax=unclassified Gracilibacillus TaxID=2625209 RepID=UPI003F886F66
MKKVLFIIDPFDPGLSLEHLIYLIHRHLEPDTEIYVKLTEQHPLFIYRLKIKAHLLPAITQMIVKDSDGFRSAKSWNFMLQSRPVPLHIRKAYYNFPSIVRLYWSYISKELMESNTFYHKAISLSPGIPAFYLRDKVQAERKIYYFPVRQFKEAVVPVSEQIQKQDIIYTASHSMYSELKINLSNVRYYEDPYYKETLFRVMKLDNAKLYRQQFLSILSANSLTNKNIMEGFIRISKILLKEETNFKWYFYGVNPNETMLHSYIQDYHMEENVVFIGELANVFGYLEKADIYVEWNRNASIEFEAEVMQKPIIHIENLSSGNEWCRIEKVLQSFKMYRDS